MPGSKRQHLKKIILSCFKPRIDDGCKCYTGHSGNTLSNWSWQEKRERHVYGEFSMAVATGNKHNEDRSQLITGPITNQPNGPMATFVGVYDGHGGPDAAQYVLDHLFLHLKRFATDDNGVTPSAISKSYKATEDGFTSLVRRKWRLTPNLATVGACCLVGVVTHGTLFIANTGDSKAVLGRGERGSSVVEAVDLSTEHNASIESVRTELRRKHFHDPGIVVNVRGVWRVKGIIQVSRSIGDVYLKSMEFQQPPLEMRYRVPRPFNEPVLSAEPSIREHKLIPKDKFVIFASDGLWEHLTSQQAVDIVNSSPRTGVAKILMREAMEVAAQKRGTRYRDMRKIDKDGRRHFHDDISIVVIFLDDRALTSATKHKGSESVLSSKSSFSRSHSRTHSIP